VFSAFPRSTRLDAGVAQLVEQLIRNQQVIGSSPIAGSRKLQKPNNFSQQREIYRRAHWENSRGVLRTAPGFSSADRTKCKIRPMRQLIGICGASFPPLAEWDPSNPSAPTTPMPPA
jgi:hypothetical protein